MTERDEQFAIAARQFADYLTAQTGVDLCPSLDGDEASLRASFAQLDIALAQISDLASVYGSDPRRDIEPLTVPTAVLVGELLRTGMGARWMEPAYEGDSSLMLVTRDGVALDLDGVARTALMSTQPNLSALLNRLLEVEP